MVNILPFVGGDVATLRRSRHGGQSGLHPGLSTASSLLGQGSGYRAHDRHPMSLASVAPAREFVGVNEGLGAAAGRRARLAHRRHAATTANVSTVGRHVSSGNAAEPVLVDAAEALDDGVVHARRSASAGGTRFVCPPWCARSAVRRYASRRVAVTP